VVYYEFKIDSYDWYNIDRFVEGLVAEDDLIEFEKLNLEVIGSGELDYINAVMVFENRNSTIPFNQVGSNTFSLTLKGGIKLPREAVDVIAYGTSGSQFFAGSFTYMLDERDHLNIYLSPIDDITTSSFFQRME
ncbi:MAG: hypothetical protein AAFY91_11545, partial [Bacteroidota bacterium]